MVASTRVSGREGASRIPWRARTWFSSFLVVLQSLAHVCFSMLSLHVLKIAYSTRLTGVQREILSSTSKRYSSFERLPGSNDRPKPRSVKKPATLKSLNPPGSGRLSRSSATPTQPKLHNVRLGSCCSSSRSLPVSCHLVSSLATRP